MLIIIFRPNQPDAFEEPVRTTRPVRIAPPGTTEPRTIEPHGTAEKVLKVQPSGLKEAEENGTRGRETKKVC